MKQRRKSQAAVINPLVVDLSHHNDVADFGAVKAAGMAGIIHKATEVSILPISSMLIGAVVHLALACCGAPIISCAPA
jgi:hypothetical protein